jgi:hypothetical protein
MKKALKLVEQWKNKLPTDAKLSDVMLVAEYYFEEELEINLGTGSHQIQIEHPSFKNYPDLSQGILTIPSVSGRFVKKYYIKILLIAIELKLDYDNEKK